MARKHRSTGYKWEITREEGDTLLEAAAYVAQHGTGDLARRSRRVVRHFTLKDPITGEEPTQENVSAFLDAYGEAAP